MKKIINIIITILLLALLYYSYDKLFEVYSNREIVVGFLVIVAILILYSSLRLCFNKKK